MDGLGKQNLGTAATVLAVIGFNVIMLLLLELPLIGYATNPDGTAAAVARLQRLAEPQRRPSRPDRRRRHRDPARSCAGSSTGETGGRPAVAEVRPRDPALSDRPGRRGRAGAVLIIAQAWLLAGHHRRGLRRRKGRRRAQPPVRGAAGRRPGPRDPCLGSRGPGRARLSARQGPAARRAARARRRARARTLRRSDGPARSPCSRRGGSMPSTATSRSTCRNCAWP